jgi:hypothetical protein
MRDASDGRADKTLVVVVGETGGEDSGLDVDREWWRRETSSRSSRRACDMAAWMRQGRGTTEAPDRREKRLRRR